MNTVTPRPHHKLQHEHTTMEAYVIGFALSLVMTFIPYYMVAHQIVSGNALLITILSFAIAQMIVQITFFLHLGRGPKPRWNLYFFIATVGIILVVVGGSIVIINNLHHNKMPSDQTKLLVNSEAIYQIGGEQTGACHGQYANHKVTIKNGVVSPALTVAKKCDTLTFSNLDSDIREISFGEHPQHVAYAGESEYIIRSKQNKTITLSESGTYRFHDHLQPDTAGYFTVTP
jgi:cytochrome o ubiquinol oxidase operon protein cyoD